MGTFFLLVSFALIALFIASDMAQSVNLSFLFFGLLSFVIGVILRIRGRQKVEPNESRFRMLRRKKVRQAPEDKKNPPIT